MQMGACKTGEISKKSVACNNVNLLVFEEVTSGVNQEKMKRPTWWVYFFLISWSFFKIKKETAT